MIFKRLLIIIIFFLIHCIAAAQPANDFCSGAMFISLPATGDTCFSVDNTTATADGFFSSCDQSPAFPIPAGGNELWFTYVATGDSNSITAIPVIGTGGMVDPSVTVITGNCSSLSTLICDDPFLGSVNFNVAAGTQVWFYITALTADGSADVCIQSAHRIIDSGTDCNTATNICDKLKFTVNDPSLFNSGGVMASCLNSPPQHTQWFKFTVGTSGTCEFTATPNGPQGYFWALWDISNGCSTSMPLLACNSVYSPGQTFGMSSAITSCLNNSFCPSVTLTAWNTYALMIDDTTLSHLGFDLEWGGTFEMTPTSDFLLDNDHICGYDSTLLVYAGNASADAIYNWNFAGANASSSGNETYVIKYPVAGNYVMSLQVTENGCISTVNSKEVVVNPVPVADAGNALSFCSASGYYPIGLPPSPGYIYHWNNSVNIKDPDSSQTFVNGVNQTTIPIDITYTLTATLGTCHNSDDVIVTINPRQSADIDPVIPKCFNNNKYTFSTLYDSVPGSTFSWSFQNGQPASSSAASPSGIHFTAPGQHLVTLITLTPGCPADTSIDTISVINSPAVSFYADISSGCPPLLVNLINTSSPIPGGTFLWNPGNGVIDTSSHDTVIVIFNTPGNYSPTLTITSAEHCPSTDTVNSPIQVFPYADATFTTSPPDPDDLNPVVAFSNSEPAGLCAYNFGDGDSSIDCQTVHSYPDTGHYQVQLIVTSSNGCIDTTYRIIDIKKYFTIYIPNAFSPNNDSRNDRLILKGEGVLDFRLRIFNRRGQMVFLSRDISNTWNGSHLDTGKQVPEGVYLYDLRVEDSNHKKHQYNGMINVIR